MFCSEKASASNRSSENRKTWEFSDTKTIDLPRATQALLEAKRLSGRVLWLNPIPEHKWQYLRSIQTMATICQMIPCSTLRDLAAACRRLVS